MSKMSLGRVEMELNSRLRLFRDSECGAKVTNRGSDSSLFVPTFISIRFLLDLILSASISDVRFAFLTTKEMLFDMVIFCIKSTFSSSYSISNVSACGKKEDGLKLSRLDTTSLIE